MTCAATNTFDLNKTCYCFPIERSQVEQTIIGLNASPDMPALLDDRKNYFASTAVFLSQDDLASMRAQITSIENVVKSEPYQQAVFTRENKPMLQIQAETSGAFMGYDFHVTQDGPRLIEINSNAGGAFIVSALEQAIGNADAGTDKLIASMFVDEWTKSSRYGRPKTIAIIDENPKGQFHYPDMLLAQKSLEGKGFDAVITDPSNLVFDGTHLKHGSVTIDLVYNRVTDFALNELKNIALHDALHSDAVVVTPAPRHHALYADKRNLVWLSDEKILTDWGVSEDDRKPLSLIPKTIDVTPENADDLWRDRRQYFFKPNAGFGSRGTYRGAKLTKRVWGNIQEGDYIAQAFIAPPVRAVTRDDGQTELKFDVRVYTYDGDPLLLAARVYQGQTTNLRTDGGGLAPVVTLEHATC